MMNDLKNENKVVQNSNNKMKVVRRGHNALTSVPTQGRFQQKKNTMVNNQAAPWEIGTAKGKQPNFEKIHEHNPVNKTNADSKPIGKTRQEIYNNRKAA